MAPTSDNVNTNLRTKYDIRVFFPMPLPVSGLLFFFEAGLAAISAIWATFAPPLSHSFSRTLKTTESFLLNVSNMSEKKKVKIPFGAPLVCGNDPKPK